MRYDSRAYCGAFMVVNYNSWPFSCECSHIVKHCIVFYIYMFSPVALMTESVTKRN